MTRNSRDMHRGYVPVLYWRGSGLDQPLGEDWIEPDGDGGKIDKFYAIDGTQIIEGGNTRKNRKGLFPKDLGNMVYDVLISKLQQY